MRKDTTISELFDLIDKADLALQRAFVASIMSVRNKFSLDDIKELLEIGAFNEALATVELAAGVYATAINNVYILAGQDTAKKMRDVLDVIVDFDQTNDRAVRVMQANRLEVVNGFTQGQRQATLEALNDGVQRGLNPREQARAFRNSIGLTQTQVSAVNNYRSLLEKGTTEALTRELRDRRFDSTVRRAARTGKPLTSSQIDRMLTRYSERYLKYRSEVIARTEALSAVHAGSEEMYRQAIDAGQIDATNLIREWRTAQDERVRDTHNGMIGQKRAMNEPFQSDAGVLLRFPGDPMAPPEEIIQCRCAVTTRLRSAA